MNQVIIAAHAFTLTDEIRDFCEKEVLEHVAHFAKYPVKIQWTLSMEGEQCVANLHYTCARQTGKTIAKGPHLLAAVREAAYKAGRMLKKNMDKRHERRRSTSIRHYQEPLLGSDIVNESYEEAA
jgi:ribosome-associated translation inhibitor RaiA